MSESVCEMLNEKIAEYENLFREASEWRNRALVAGRLLDDAKDYVPFATWRVRYEAWKRGPILAALPENAPTK